MGIPSDLSATPPRWAITFDRPAQLQAALLVAAFFAVFWEMLAVWPPDRLGTITDRWVYDSDWSHGPIIPLFSAYLVYLRWNAIRRCPVRYTWVGLVLMLAGLGTYWYALWGIQFGYVRPAAMMLTLLGLLVWLNGLPMLRYAWLPWLYLFFAIPIPQRAYFLLTDPLQRLAAIVTCAVLDLLPHLDIERVGIIIHPTYNGVAIMPLSVTDACSGMRSTMVLCALGTAVAFMTSRPWWHRLILLASCVPIATFCNFVRVTITCCLHIYADPKYAEGTYHTVLGLLVILLAVVMFLGLGWLLTHLFVEDRAEPGDAAQGPDRLRSSRSGGAR